MRGSVNENMPKVSYLKAIDYFLLGSFSFIFMTLVEYVLVLKLVRKRKYKEFHEENKTSNEDLVRLAIKAKISKRVHVFYIFM